MEKVKVSSSRSKAVNYQTTSVWVRCMCGHTQAYENMHGHVFPKADYGEQQMDRTPFKKRMQCGLGARSLALLSFMAFKMQLPLSIPFFIRYSIKPFPSLLSDFVDAGHLPEFLKCNDTGGWGGEEKPINVISLLE